MKISDTVGKLKNEKLRKSTLYDMKLFRLYFILVMAVLGCSREQNEKLEEFDAFCEPNSHLAMINLVREGKIDSVLFVTIPQSSIVDTLALSEQLSLSSDTNGLISEHRNTNEDSLNQCDVKNDIIPNTQHNYINYERELSKTEKKLYIYMIVISISSIISLILLVIILYLKLKDIYNKESHATTVNLLNEIKNLMLDENVNQKEFTDNLYEETINDEKEYQNGNGVINKGFTDSNDNNKQESPLKTKENIMSGIKIDENKNFKLLINPSIPASTIYQILLKKIQSESVIAFSEEDNIFKNLEELIESVSHGFLYRLQVLTEGKVTATENRIAMLIKCGFSPLQISILLGKEKNTISTHRRNLAFKITGHKKSDHTLDAIIITL